MSSTADPIVRPLPATWAEAEQQFFAVFDHAPVGIAIVGGPELRFSLANPTYRAIPGRADVPMVGRTVSEVFPDLAPEGVEALHRVMRTGAAERLQEFEANLGPGRECTWWNVEHVPLFGAEGRAEGVLILALEVTEQVLARQQLQAALEEAEEGRRTLDAIMEYVPEGITIADAPDVRILRVSRYGQELTGRPPQVIEGISANEHEHAEHWGLYHLDGATPAQDPELPLTRAVLQGEVSSGEEWLLRRPDGSQITLLCNAGPIRSAAGETIGGLIAWRDISERKQMEAALRESEDHYRHTVDLNPQIPWTASPEGELLSVSPRWAEQTGHATEATLGERWMAAIHPEDLPRTLQTWANALHSGEPYDVEHRVACAEGGYRWMRSRAFPRRDEQGGIVRWYGTTEDVHEARLAQQRLEGLQRLTAELARAASPAEVADVAIQQGIAFFGAQSAALGVVTAGGAEMRMLSHEQHPESVLREWQHFPLSTPTPMGEVARSGEPLFFETREALLAGYEAVRAAVETLGLQATAVLPLAAGGGVLGVMSYNYHAPRGFDATTRALMQSFAAQVAQALERARLYEAEQTARAAAEEANRAKTEFLAAMSHDLRTPLNAISGYIDLLDLGIHGPLNEAQKDDLMRIRRNQAHLLSLIHDVLAFAKIEAGRVEYELRPLSVCELMQDLEPMIAPQLQAKGLAYACEPCSAEWQLVGDEEKVRQILLNLVGNAIKFTPTGGWVSVSAVREAERVRIRVRDSGPGIPEAQQRTIFDPFVQLGEHRDRPREGVGLGLAISRQLAQGMGGDLSVESVPGQGATFTLSLAAVGDGA